MLTDYALEQLVNKFTKKYNYSEIKNVIKIFAKMDEEEKKKFLTNSEVQKTIFGIEDGEILREIFRSSPVFFQEEMFRHQHIQDLMIVPNDKKRETLIERYNCDYCFLTTNQINSLGFFIGTIKSPLVKRQLIDNRIFQKVIAANLVLKLSKYVFKTLDKVQLFYNIVNDEEIYINTNIDRKKHVLYFFNKISDYILLAADYRDVIKDVNKFIEERRLYGNNSRVFIDEKTLDLFTKDMLEELLKFDNLGIDRTIIEDLLKDDIRSTLKNNNYDFKKIFPDLDKRRADSFKIIYYLYYKVIMEECSEDIKSKLIDFIFNILCNTEELDESDKKAIKDMLYYKINTNSIYKDDYESLFWVPNYLKTIFYLRFGVVIDRMDYLKGITKDQLMNVNVKHINQIFKVLHIANEDEILYLYNYAIKMYLTFGLERTLGILRGEYGTLNRVFFDNLSRLDTSNVELVKEGKKYIPNINLDFINFMFAKEKDNHFREILGDTSSLLAKNWSYLYNNLEELKARCHGALTLKKVNIILKELSPTRDIKDISPDNYRLKENNILENVCLGNKTSKSNEEVYKKLLDIYDEMKKRNEASIPYIEGNCANGYSYEMMKLNDPIAFTLGYKGNCCIRVGDIAHNHLLHATLCRNGRILLIYDENHELAAFVILKRNGELLIANSIECLHKVKNDLAVDAFMDAINNLVLTTSKSDEAINLVCIGSEAYARPEGIPFPKEIPTPTILEKDDTRYHDTDKYHKELTIVYKNQYVDLENIKLGDPKVSYQDPRNKVKSCDFYQDSSEEVKQALQVINAVRYANASLDDLANFRMCSRYRIKTCVYNDDWYLLTTSDGGVCGDYLKNDDRAFKEFNIAVLEYQKQKEDNKQEEIKPLVLKYC